MYKLTFPELQNPYPCLTSMTPSGSIPSGPPCSLQTRTLQLANPFPSHPNCTGGVGIAHFTTSLIRLPCPRKCTLPAKRAKEAEGTGHIIYCAPAKMSRTDEGPSNAGSLAQGPCARCSRLARAPRAELRPLHCASRCD